LFAGRHYHPGNFENLMSGLLSAIRQFVFELALRKRWGTVLEELNMAEFYRCRDLPLRASQALKRAESALLEISPVSEEHAWLRWQTDREVFLQAAAGNQRKGLLHLPDTLRSLLSLFAPELLQLTAAYANQQRVSAENHDDWGGFLKGFRALCREAAYFGHTGLSFLDQALQLMDQGHELTRPQLDDLNRSFKERWKDMSEKEAKVIAAYLRNALIKILAQYTLKERFDFYREQLEAGWLYEHDRLQASSFLNMVKLALQAGDQDWLRNFLTIHQDRINGTQKENVRLIGEAQCFFSRKEWKMVDHCLIALRQLPKLRDISLEKLMRLLEIKTAFELEQYEHLSNLLSSFQIFLKRNQTAIGQSNYLADYNFIKALRALSRQKNKSMLVKSKSPQKVYKNWHTRCLDPDFLLAEKEWLTEKCSGK